MNIDRLSTIRSTGLTTAQQTETQTAEKLSPLTSSLRKADARLQTQLGGTTANLSSLGKFKAAVAQTQVTARNLSGLQDTSSSDDVKKALNRFITDFNAMVASAKTVTGSSNETNRIGRGMARAITADLSQIGVLNRMGVSKAADGTLQLNTAQFTTAYQASPTGIRTALAKLGQLADKVAEKELASDGRLSNTMNALKQRSSTLQSQHDALLKLSQKMERATQTPTGSGFLSQGVSAYQW